MPETVAGPPRLKYFIVQRQDLLAISTRFVETQGYWLIEDTESPVIEFSPSIFTGSKLTSGRAYFASDLRFRPELPSPDFVRWGDRVLTRIKKKLSRHPEFAPSYFGASAVQWIRDSGAILTGGAFTIHERRGTH